MDFIDYYKILGLSKSATEDDIKKAYRKLARKYHPDLNPNDKIAEQKFKELNEANEVLSNVENRKKYDEYGKDWKHADEIKNSQQQQRGSRSYSNADGNFSNDEDYSDFFSSMFNGNRQQNSRSNMKYRGQDCEASLSLHIREVYQTKKQTLNFNDKKINLTIPAGVQDEQMLRIKGHGGEGVNGGPKGDLLLTLHIINDTKFKLVGSDLHTKVDLDLYVALLGGIVTVDLFEGNVTLKVKPETQNGTKVKLKGKGFPIYKQAGEFGDMIITYDIRTPINLTPKEIELFTELSNLRAL